MKLLTSIEKSKETELIYDNLLETIDVGFYQVTIDGQMLNHNRAHNIILGYSSSESLKSKDVRQFWQNPQHREIYLKYLLNNGFTKDYICHALKKDGTKIVVELSSHLIRDETGIPVRIDGTFIDVTEKYTLQKKLEESEEKYRLITENANDLIRVLNENFEFEYLNESVHKRILGYENKDMIGKTSLPFLHPDDRKDATRSTYHNLKRGKGSYQARFKDKNGNYKWFEFAGKYFFDGKKVKKILSIARDINERKIAELKLKESEEKYRLISETAYDLIGVLNNKFKYEYINETAFQQILGYSSKDLLGKSALIFTHPNDIASTVNALTEGFKQGEGGAELRFRHKEGHWVWIEAKGKTFIDKDGKLNAIVISRDITNRKFSEKKLKESEEKYRLISENANEIITVQNEDFQIEYVNEIALKNILGYCADEVIGKPTFQFAHPDDRKETILSFNKLLMKESLPLQSRYKHKDGRYVWLEINLETYFNSQGEKKYLTISRDITKIKEAEQKLRSSEKRYREAYNIANFYKDLFAHDINNILHIISSSAELISYYLGDSEKSKVIDDISNIIKKQVERGAKLVSNVHILSKLEEDEIHAQPTEICRLMENAIDFIKKSYNNRIIHINIDCDEDHITVNANELLQDVFENILLNGVKYNENSNIEIRIRVSKMCINNKKYNKIEFIDNGIGVSDDRKEIVFKRGNREIKGAKGMGLGLSLVKEILNTFNGKIWVEDKIKGDYSKGSNFVIILPELE